MSARRGAVAVVGPAYCDLVFAGLEELPALGTENFAPHFLVTAGGSAITAIALRRLGRPAALIADVGEDAHGAVIREALEREGVGAGGLRATPGLPTPVTAVLSTREDRAFVTHLATPATPRDLAAALDAARPDHLHVAGCSVALAQPGLLELCRARGVTTSFDPGWHEEALADARVRRLADAVDLLLPNRPEAARLAGLEADADADAALAALAARRPNGVTVVKDGARGALGVDATGRARVSAPPVVVVDTTGAGDVFDAGFLDAWLGGAALEACLRRGVTCGSRAVGAFGGATAAPTRDELEVGS